jgi:hypothetical protein
MATQLTPDELAACQEWSGDDERACCVTATSTATDTTIDMPAQACAGRRRVSRSAGKDVDLLSSAGPGSSPWRRTTNGRAHTAYAVEAGPSNFSAYAIGTAIRFSII